MAVMQVRFWALISATAWKFVRLQLDLRRDRFAAGEKANNKPEDESADMRPPGDTVESVSSRAQAHCAIEKLEQKPNAQEQHSRKNKCGAKEERRHERFDAGKWIKAEVSTHHCGDSSARADCWHGGIGIGKDMQQRSSNASREIQHYV